MLHHSNAIIEQQETLDAGNSGDNEESLESYTT
jgi:hypothetical protein